MSCLNNPPCCCDFATKFGIRGVQRTGTFKETTRKRQRWRVCAWPHDLSTSVANQNVTEDLIRIEEAGPSRMLGPTRRRKQGVCLGTQMVRKDPCVIKYVGIHQAAPSQNAWAHKKAFTRRRQLHQREIRGRRQAPRA